MIPALASLPTTMCSEKKGDLPPGEEEEDKEGRGEAALHAEVQGGVAEKAAERPSTEVVCGREQNQTGGEAPLARRTHTSR